ncbi:response regulator receiver protein [Parafrankia sp. EAN1pec]|nr:response regulator receiver protein [Frankia sp. EAN1pec]
MAVQSELAARLVEHGDAAAAERMLEVRQVAHDSLREMRAVVDGYRRADLGAELAGARAMRAEVPGCANVIVTSHGRPGYLKQALAAGACGFLPKTVSAQVLADVVRAVHGGGRYVDPELAAEAIAAGESPLTSREAEVLELGAVNRHEAVQLARARGWI